MALKQNFTKVPENVFNPVNHNTMLLPDFYDKFLGICSIYFYNVFMTATQSDVL